MALADVLQLSSWACSTERDGARSPYGIEQLHRKIEPRSSEPKLPHVLVLPPRAGLLPHAAAMCGCEALYCESSRPTRQSPEPDREQARQRKTKDLL